MPFDNFDAIHVLKASGFDWKILSDGLEVEDGSRSMTVLHALDESESVWPSVPKGSVLVERQRKEALVEDLRS